MGRAHVDGEAALLVLTPDEDVEQVRRCLRAVDESAVIGVVWVPRGTDDWAFSRDLAGACSAAARRLGLDVGRLEDPAVASEVLVEHACRAAEELVAMLPIAPYDVILGAGEPARRLRLTLSAWISHGQDVAAAAKNLNLHANTLRYRLRRAEDVARVDLSDPRQLLALQLLLNPSPVGTEAPAFATPVPPHGVPRQGTMVG